MKNEIENIPLAFNADVQREIFNHRGTGTGLVDSFVTNVGKHRERVETKLRNLADRADAGQFAAAIEAARAKVAEKADSEIARAQKAGCVEFEAA